MIKGIRKSLKDRNSKSSSISSPIADPQNKRSVSSAQDIQINTNNLLQSPKKVIKAIYDYQPQGPGELAFKKGDFFHVIGNENDPDWYEACNPSTNIRGMVPVPYFEVFGKTRPLTNEEASRSSSISHQGQTLGQIRPLEPQEKRASGNTLYAIVLYDFQAERSDELDVSTGENLIICAHHNYEWFIAKPIGRLGGPGLVPVGFVAITNPATGENSTIPITDDIINSKLPTVDEWKEQTAKYKASSIPLGTVDPSQTTPTLSSSQEFKSFNTDSNYEVAVDQSRPTIRTGSVDEFHVEEGRYWFELNCELNTGEIRTLCRYYDDFYEFQLKLLELFPREAGKLNPKDRILPYIPGPLTYVTDKITKKRQIDLDQYIKELVRLPAHISQSNLVKDLFELRHRLDKIIDLTKLNINGNGHDNDSETMGQLRKDESMKTITNNHSSSNINNTITTTPQDTSTPAAADSLPVVQSKIKFYYKDDIFALLLNSNIVFSDLVAKIKNRIYDDDSEQKPFKIFEKDSSVEIVDDEGILTVLKNKLKVAIIDEDDL
ncbi:hypothetical protein WICPIJ_003192 [Wickerhamomyces pijperi]|uniref:Bud emergence protein 1 n=1 Tax=Wickerhamomyces pijperi TaxID=599730 RepID=A0A9P8TN85_WICPI|nr:hypothetical protein WICPIJ_003192 [Wickerhamomyces pijperi]